MKERPIIFSGPMVQAILAGRKTQTRRAIATPRLPLRHGRATRWPSYEDFIPHIKDPGLWCWRTDTGGPTAFNEFRCPYGVPGDRLWVKETWRQQAYSYADEDRNFAEFQYRADCSAEVLAALKWCSSRFMPREASRVLLEITDVRVQRLQEISEEDAKAETVDGYVAGHGLVSPLALAVEPGFWHERLYRAGFEYAWDQLNGKRAPWEDNPWVWALTFRRIEA